MEEVITSILPSFEDFQHQNGIKFRWASEFMKMLGYNDLTTFEKVITKATKTFSNLGINVFENIRQEDNNGEYDYKLTRYACYIIAMSGDTKKQEVALAQNYFAEQTRRFEILQQDPERLSIRSEFASGFKALNSIAKQRGVTDYVKFNQAGNLGLYKMESWKLAKKRGIDKTKIFDSMGRTELAANLFRVTQTEERIKNKCIVGQTELEKTHYEVGGEVRDFVIKNTGVLPENLKQEMPLQEIKKGLKKAHSELKKKDK